MGWLRRSEWVVVVYFVYATILSQVLPLRPPIPALTLVLNLAILGSYALLAYADSLRRRRFLSIVRDWYPLPLVMMAYREMGWFAPPERTFALEQAWVKLDRLFLNDLGVRAAIESLGPLVPSILEIAYSLVYIIPHFSIAMLYVYGRRKRADDFLFPFVLAVLAAYALFPYFPSEPPRTVFAGQDLPTQLTIFRRFNLGLLRGYGIHTSVFPSAHVSGAFSAAVAMSYVLPERKRVARVLFVLAILIATATVYGRYHYLVDAMVGCGIGIVAALLACRRLTFPSSKF